MPSITGINPRLRFIECVDLRFGIYERIFWVVRMAIWGWLFLSEIFRESHNDIEWTP